jgi:hypothetical protein
MSDSSVNKVERNDAVLILDVLSAIEKDSRVTQRSLSSQLGIALGLANAVMKRCVRKGLVKIASAPINRYSYYLTPSGLAEKSRLTVEYLRFSFDLFRDARRQYGELFAALPPGGDARVALYGASELAEAALLSARERGIEIVGLIDPKFGAATFVGLRVVSNPAALGVRVDAIAICDMRDPLTAYETAVTDVATYRDPGVRVLAPQLLRLGRRAAERDSKGAA